MFFWAWEEHKNRMARARDELARALDEARAEGLAEGLTEGRAEGRAETAKEYETTLAMAAREREESLAAARERAMAEGVDLDKYLNP